ncbi:hypothetical protein Tco_0979597 [Tanacetum coccineum]
MKAIQEDVKAKKPRSRRIKISCVRLFRAQIGGMKLVWEGCYWGRARVLVSHSLPRDIVRRKKLIGTSSQYPVPNLYTPQAFSSPNYTPPNFDGYRPIFEHRSTSQIVRDAYLDGDHLDVDGDNTGDGDGSDSLDSDSGDDSNDACDED